MDKTPKREPLTPRTPKSLKGTPLNEHIINIMTSPATKQLFKEEDYENSFCYFPFSVFQKRENKEFEMIKEINKLKLENHKLNVKLNYLSEDSEQLQKELSEIKKEMMNMKYEIQIRKAQQEVIQDSFISLPKNAFALGWSDPIIKTPKSTEKTQRHTQEDITLISFFILILSLLLLILMN